MVKKKNINDAVEILHRKFIKDRPDRISSLETERVNAEVAKIIHDLRKDAGLNQKELAVLVGTTQSAISRLEDADYEGHSLSMLNRIAKALNHRLTVFMIPRNQKGPAFDTFIKRSSKRSDRHMVSPSGNSPKNRP